MSGHSKWANIKHRKAAQDSKKGVAFQKLVKNVIAAAKAGGGDPNANFRLKVAIDRARAGNVPVDNIERGIKRGTGELDGAIFEEILYEGYGPNGVAVMVQALTDNRNRTAPEMRSLFTKTGGSIGELGCVAWNFDRKGIIEVTGEGIDEEEIMMATATLRIGSRVVQLRDTTLMTRESPFEDTIAIRITDTRIVRIITEVPSRTIGEILTEERTILRRRGTRIGQVGIRIEWLTTSMQSLKTEEITMIEGITTRIVNRIIK